MNNTLVYSIGFFAQGLFSARLLVQWLLSEKAKKVESPIIYWQLSILASFLLFIYGWLRDDFAIILGQYISYFIYIWNLNNKGHWKSLNILVKSILLLTPAFVVVYLLFTFETNFPRLFENKNIPLGILIFGSLGQIIFTLRFIYQWIYSRKKGESVFPVSFWLLSLLGTVIIISYGIYRKDPVLVLGQSAGFIAYIRNLWLSKF